MSGSIAWRSPPRRRTPAPSKTYKTSSHGALPIDGETPGRRSSTRSEIAVAPRARPAWLQARTVPCSSGLPSRSPLTRQPPARRIAIRETPHYPRPVDDRRTLGIDATNQAFSRYDQVEKKQEYHLAEGRHDEAFDEEFRIRTCDIGRFLRGDDADRTAFAKELGEALREIGFAVLEGHAVDPALYAEAEAATAELFTAVSLPEKLR